MLHDRVMRTLKLPTVSRIAAVGVTAALALGLPATAGAAETVVTVQSNPIVVYGMVGLLVGATLLAVLFVLPWRKRRGAGDSDTPVRGPHFRFAHAARGKVPWMPGGDFIHADESADRAPSPESPAEPPPAAVPAPLAALAAPGRAPWSTGTPETGQWPTPGAGTTDRNPPH